MQSLAPSTSLCAYDWSFAAGLIEASTQVVVGQDATLLISFDLPYPEPIHARRPILGMLGVALLLARDRSPQASASLDIQIMEQGLPPTPCADVQLEHQAQAKGNDHAGSGASAPGPDEAEADRRLGRAPHSRGPLAAACTSTWGGGLASGSRMRRGFLAESRGRGNAVLFALGGGDCQCRSRSAA